MSHDPIVQALQKFSSCDVSDALLKLKYPRGGFLSGLTLWSPQRQAGPTKIVGPAYTVEYVPKDNGADPKLKGHYIDSIPAGCVLFISAPAWTVNAVYGGLMSNRAKYLGAVGTIVDGRVRDLQEHRDLEYPVFARDVGTTAPQEKLKVSEPSIYSTSLLRKRPSVDNDDKINTPVPLQSEDQDATIHPADYLIGDLNGVVCLPKELAEKAVALMASQVEADEKIARDLEQGRSFEEASKEHRANVKKAEDL